ncbi:TetR/AcrR family transcriptional regulator [Phenylobacterium sp.]|uniref:TetR/AcrR family transcriptional regulator n=1 Tax=Phenylobacterium sp. TaxID=1871053 RepID=UPI002724D4D0|nr:helix-turn-helix domain-containing protein [Phenylobacterium sp.]MDO8381246.1 helix-turn-helix domain-containing protein [Phenylobacterium sp.]
MSRPTERDRDATRARLLDAAAQVLSRKGYSDFGVNAVAREAGCDKVLIYRYFGGLEGLAQALGERLDVWLRLDLPLAPGGYGMVMGGLLGGYLQALRANGLVKRILAWELVDTGPTVRALGAAKSRAVSAWFQRARAQAAPPPADLDAPAINAILLAAAHHLALREDHDGTFAGLDLTQPDTWRRIETAMDLLIARAYPAAAEDRRHD